MGNLSAQLRMALERTYENGGRRPDLVLSQRTWVSAMGDLSYAARQGDEHTLTDLTPYIRNLVLASWLSALADPESLHPRDRDYPYDMEVAAAITDELSREPVCLNKDTELVWLPLHKPVIWGLTTHSLTNPDPRHVAKYAAALMASNVTHKVATQLSRIIDDYEDVFVVIDNLHIPAVERMVEWSVSGLGSNRPYPIPDPLPLPELLAAITKLSTVIRNANETHLNMARDLISNYNVTLGMAAHVLELAQSEEARTLSLYALSRGKMYPANVDWRAAADVYRTVASAELVEELFGAVSAS